LLSQKFCVHTCDSSWENFNELIEQGIRGNKRSKINQLKIMTEIRKLLPDRVDYEIMKILGIPNSTYYRYKSQIYQQDTELWNQIAKESLESRALKIMKSLELCIAVNTEIATDKQQDPKSRIEANIMAYNILENGPKPQLINYS
jgi:ACT domain-containing protein